MKAAKRPLTLLISTVWPEPTSSAAGVRTLQLLSCFSKWGHEVALASPASKTTRSAVMTSHSVADPVREIAVTPNSAEFDTMIRSLQPNIVIFDRFIMEEQFGWRVREQAPRALRIVDSQDLHFLRDYRNRQALHANNISKGDDTLVAPGWNDMPSALNSDIAHREVASFLRSDATLLISAAEQRLLESHNESQWCLSGYPLVYLPFLPEKATGGPDYKARSDNLVMIGNFLHKPNLDSVRSVREYYQLSSSNSRKLPSVHVYGAYYTGEFGAMQSSDPFSSKMATTKGQISIFGACDDALATIQRYRVLFAPLRFGAGLKGKIFDALITGTPFVTTKVGAEGIIDNDCTDNIFGTQSLMQKQNFISKHELHSRLAHLCIADTMSEAIQKAERLIHDEEIWSEAAMLGSRLLSEEFSCAVHTNNLKVAMDSLMGGDISDINSFDALQDNKRRPKGLLQRVLSHESVHYSRMLSKYIELKNKR
jgi:hypothetical protein